MASIETKKTDETDSPRRALTGREGGAGGGSMGSSTASPRCRQNDPEVARKRALPDALAGPSWPHALTPIESNAYGIYLAPEPQSRKKFVCKKIVVSVKSGFDGVWLGSLSPTWPATAMRLSGWTASAQKEGRAPACDRCSALDPRDQPRPGRHPGPVEIDRILAASRRGATTTCAPGRTQRTRHQGRGLTGRRSMVPGSSPVSRPGEHLVRAVRNSRRRRSRSRNTHYRSSP